MVSPYSHIFQGCKSLVECSNQSKSPLLRPSGLHCSRNQANRKIWSSGLTVLQPHPSLLKCNNVLRALQHWQKHSSYHKYPTTKQSRNRQASLFASHMNSADWLTSMLPGPRLLKNDLPSTLGGFPWHFQPETAWLSVSQASKQRTLSNLATKTTSLAPYRLLSN